MAFVPEITYPQIIDLKMDDDTPFLGSVEFNTARPVGGKYRLGTVIDIDMSDFDENVHVSSATGLKKKLVTFSNGSYFESNVYQTSIQVGAPVYVELKSYNENDQFIPVVNTTYLCQGRVYPGVNISASANWVRAYGMKVYIVTDYYDANNFPVPDVTPPFGFAIRLVLPSKANDAGYGTWECFMENIVSGADICHGYDPDYPSYASEHLGPFTWDIIRTTNVDSFIQAMGFTDVEEGYDVRSADDPTQETDPSTPGGGGGNYDNTSDPIDFPELPVGGALSSGAIRAFIVTPGILQGMFATLWDLNLFNILTQFQKLVDNPMDAIISLHCLPVTPQNSNQGGDIILGSFDTGSNGIIVDSQYLTVDCGQLDLKEYWGSALDYNPYTKTEIYLPFIGVKELNTDDVMNSTLHIKYNIDVLTGDCLANIKCGMSVLYKYNGNLKQDIPLSGRSSDQLLKFAQGNFGMVGSFATGAAIGGGLGGAIALGSALSAASNVLSSKVTTTRAGSLAGSVGLLDDFRPYLIIHRPVQSLAKDFKKFKGYPSNITSVLSAVKGYTEVEFINLQNIPNATSAEMDEIKNLLGRGVLL